MNKEDLLNEYQKSINEHYHEYAALATLVDKWLNGEINYGSEELQSHINSKLREIDELKKLSETYLSEYNKISQIDANKKNAVYRYNLDNEEEALRQRRLNEVKNAILNNQIDIEQAEILKDKINDTFTQEDVNKVSSL